MILFDFTLDLFDRFLLGSLALQNQAIGDVVLVDVTHLGHRFLIDLLVRHILHIVEPEVGGESALGSFLAQLRNPARAGIVGRERKQGLVQPGHGLLAIVVVDHPTYVLAAGWMFASVSVMSPTFISLPVAGITCMTPIAPTGPFAFWLSRDSW